jgi:hypothetical protein
VANRVLVVDKFIAKALANNGLIRKEIVTFVASGCFQYLASVDRRLRGSFFSNCARHFHAIEKHR